MADGPGELEVIKSAFFLTVMFALAAMAAACGSPSAEPQVVEVPVTVEVPVEVVKEVVVTATPVPTSTPLPGPSPTPGPTATPRPTPTPEPKLHFKRTLSSGGSHTCGLRENGTAVCWGNDEVGQASPPRSERFVSISAGGLHTCGLLADGKAVCWGSNEDGRSSPPRDDQFRSISAGGYHTCGVRTDARVVCWGNNEYGQADPPGSAFALVSSATESTCGLRTDGRASCWGRPYSEAPSGKFVTLDSGGGGLTPIQPGGWTLVGRATCGLRENGRAVCWESGDSSQPPAGTFVSISSSAAFACGVRTDGAALCWGENSQGQADAPRDYDFVTVSAGATHACGLLDDGAVVCWGANLEGQASPKGGRFALPSTGDPEAQSSSGNSFNAASVLARFSTPDPAQGEARAGAAGEIIARHQAGNPDTDRVLDLLHTVAPELSIDQRRRAADELASFSQDEEWDEAETAGAVFYLSSLITGDEPNPDERIAAASEMVERYESGSLEADRALDLMDTIAPGLSVNQRRQAAGALARLSPEDGWDDAHRTEAANEVFRLVTGVPLAAEQRIGAAVDLAGIGVRIFDTEGQFDDRQVEDAAEIIKQSLTGQLTPSSLQDILDGKH